ncbi:MAG: Wzz/FepE/Etk N-terminal domain-containing protein [Solirubrobacteraceae bacterium]
MTSNRQEPTIADYLRVLRQHRLLIAFVTIVYGAAALGVSLLQKPSYSAEASISVRDPNQDLTLLGGTGSSALTPDQIAAAHLPQVTRPSVVQRVQADVHSSLTDSQLNQAVDVHVDPTSNLILIDATARHGDQAAAIANAFASEDARQSTTEARRTFASEARHLALKIRSLGATNSPTTRLIYADQLSRLQSLSAVAEPVQVSSAATVPASPTSPKPVRNTVVGAIIGLLLGIALGYGRNALDRRLRHPDEVEEHLGLRLLGYVREEALGHGGVISNGRGPVEDPDLEGFRILRQNIEFLEEEDEHAQCVVVTSAMAEEGKSTVAAGLALASAAAGKQTLLLECDLRKPVLAGRMGVAKGPGLAEYLGDRATPQEVLQVVPLLEPSAYGAALEASSGQPAAAGQGCQLVCITAGAVLSRPAELLASPRFRALLSDVRAAYDVVVIDSSPLLPVVDTLEFVPYVSSIVVCVRCDRTTRDQARAVRSCLERLPTKPAGAVVTGMRHGEGYYGYYGSEQ